MNKNILQPLVSILMPVYNAGDYLKECLRSIVDQSYGHWELICVDDFSTDDSKEIILDQSRNDTRIKYIQNHEKGIIPALRNALINSTGIYISRMDADDIMCPDKIELLLEKLLHHGRSHIATGMVKYFSEDTLGPGYKKYEEWLNGLSLHENNFEDIYKECVIPSPCWMIHREDLKKAGAFDPDIYPEDYELCFRFRAENYKVVSVKKQIHYWRDHSHRSSRTKEEYSDNRFLELKINKFLSEDLDLEKQLVLWGAGSKGKYIAKELTARAVDFRWLCNTHSKIGHVIYGTRMESFSAFEFDHNSQLISAVAQKGSRTVLTEKLEACDPEMNGIQIFEFC